MESPRDRGLAKGGQPEVSVRNLTVCIECIVLLRKLYINRNRKELEEKSLVIANIIYIMVDFSPTINGQ